MKVLFLDTETAGAEPKQDRLIQLAYKQPGGKLVEEMFTPPIPISYSAMAVHHITPRMLKGKPAFKESPVFNQLSRLLEQHVLVAHNAEFDVGILRNEGLKRNANKDSLLVNSLQVNYPKGDGGDFICTFKLAHKYLQTDIDGKPLLSRSLQYLRYALDLESTLPKKSTQPIAHTAGGDVIILEKLFDKLVEVITKELGTTDEDRLLAHMLEVTQMPILLRHVRFGKHRGKTWEEVASTDRDYLVWLSKQPDLDSNLKHTLEHYLRDFS